MTSTWDIIAENFGFMLVFGDTMFIQFVFSIPSWLIFKQPLASAAVSLDNSSIVTCIATFAIGYFIFRVSNKQKHDFKAESSCLIWGRPAKTIGGRLLVSGFWGCLPPFPPSSLLHVKFVTLWTCTRVTSTTSATSS